MAFHSVLFPVDVQYGYAGGPGFATVVQQTHSGHEERVARWSSARHRYRPSKEQMTATEVAAVRHFYLERRGALHSFRFKDWHDFTSAADDTGDTDPTDQIIGEGDGAEVNFQLRKQYGSDNTYVRPIQLPVEDSVSVAFDGVEQLSGWTVSLTTGIVTFTSAPALGVVVTAGFEFDVPVRFERNIDELLSVRIPNFARADVLDIDLIEVFDEIELPELWHPGGCNNLDPFSADANLSMHDGKVQFVNPDASGLNLFLPHTEHLPGGEYFTFVIKSGASGTLNIRDDAGNIVYTAAPSGAIVRLFLVDDGGTKTWRTVP